MASLVSSYPRDVAQAKQGRRVRSNQWKHSRASVLIRGDAFDPDSVTDLLGLTPSRVWRRGELHGKRRPIRYRISGWELASTLSKTEPLERHVTELVDQLARKARVLERIRTELRAHTHLSCCFSFEGCNAGFVLAPKTLARLGRLGLELWADIYASDCTPVIGSPAR